MAEMVDIFDEDERKIGTVPKEEAYEKHMLRRGAGAVIFNSKGQLLIHRRSLNRDCNAGAWDFKCVGWVRSGEEPMEAAKREAKEESGAEGDVRLIMRTRYESGNANDFDYFYRMTYDGPITIDPEEVAEYEWIDPKDLKGLMSQRKFAKNAIMLYPRFEEQGVFS